ncbi:hypothetical protein BRADI_4g23622v3 [Brachypodium distachyon]|uniref:Uncharacterized protein n=1 Tax=Brachypodium distachyon TaxID=15368 RepID=A0A2K2CPR9_BRADI|nr:hypothetical protein BRADI_4g23622v3 [Brachypodium distachyon]
MGPATSYLRCLVGPGFVAGRQSRQQNKPKNGSVAWISAGIHSNWPASFNSLPSWLLDLILEAVSGSSEIRWMEMRPGSLIC